MNAELVLGVLAQAGHEGAAVPSVRPGHIRLYLQSNDVYWAIEKMGGTAAAAQFLGVTSEEIESWIDQYYVPSPYVERLSKKSGYLKYCLQESPFYVSDGTSYWPHTPTDAEIYHPGGMCLIGVHTLSFRVHASKISPKRILPSCHKVPWLAKSDSVLWHPG